MPDWEVTSAGTNRNARTPVSRDLLEWADVTVWIERRHRDIPRQRFKEALTDDRIFTLDIPDGYDFMDPQLIKMLRRLLPGWLDRIRPGESE